MVPGPAREEALVDRPIDVLRRWQDSGGTWRVTARGPDGVELDLLTCTGDEVMGRLVSADGDLLAFVAESTGAEE
jgi:hypothetical protein